MVEVRPLSPRLLRIPCLTFILWLSVAILITLSTPANALCTAPNGFPSDPYCLCRSGYYNLNTSDCDGEHNGTCSFAVPEWLVTTVPAELDRSRTRVSNNAFEFYILSDFTQARLMKKITLNNPVPGCVYPGSFSKGLHGCQDEFSGVVAFPNLLSNCQFQKTAPGTYVGNLFIEVEDYLGMMGSHPTYRTTKSFMKIALNLQTSITFTLDPNSTVFSVPELMATVSRQRLSLADKQNIGLELVASLQYPYVVVASSLTGPSGIVGTAPTFNNDKCADPTPYSPCFQRVDFGFIIPSTNPELHCNLTGAYSVDFTVGCRTGQIGQAGCPLNSLVTRTYHFNLISPKLCNPVDIVLTIRPTMTTYADLGRKTPKNQFLANQTAFFFIDLESSITLSSAQILSLNITDGSKQDFTRVLCSNSACSNSLANSTQLNLIPFSRNSTGFSLTMVVNPRGEPFNRNVHLFDSNSADYFNVSLSVWLSVSFPPKFQSRKRGLMAEERVFLKTKLILDLSSLGVVQHSTSPPNNGDGNGDGDGNGGGEKSEARRAGVGGLLSLSFLLMLLVLLFGC